MYPLAEAGDVKSAIGMGLLYAHGLGVGQDPVAASHWFDRAARHVPSPHAVLRTLAEENRDYLARQMDVNHFTQASGTNELPTVPRRSPYAYADWPDGKPPDFELRVALDEQGQGGSIARQYAQDGVE